MLHDVATFSVIYLLFGLLGGIIRIFFDRKFKPGNAVGYIVVGAISGGVLVKPVLLVANYSALALTYFTPQFLALVRQFPPEVVALFIGMGGIEYCYLTNRFLLRKLRQFGRAKNE
jgi:predicted membrane channel-forming protein YqfA (hemolysin III family)